ncbi:MAG TPA: heavy metal translocating P-type ATPase [Terriglobales bacterium]|nr:heavy metal translocating P-type ATPase [Terriglobales bacterium]
MPDTEKHSDAVRNCDLCGLPCGRRPYLQRIHDRERSFCCLGCMNVYLILSESGEPGQDFRETELYKRSLELGLISNPEAAPTAASAPQREDGAYQELLLHVRGMWCTSCAWLIEYALTKLPGVAVVEASFATDLVKIKYLPQRIPPSHLIDRIVKLGYRASEFRPNASAADTEKRDLLLRLGVASFLWMNVMYLSMTFYISFFEHIADSIRHYIPFIVWGLATPVVFYSGFPILRLAWQGLRNRTIRSEALLSLGILAAYCFSIVQAFRSDPRIYFDTACVIVALVLAGKTIERNAKDRASRWIANLHSWMPNKVRILSGGLERFASVEALEPGQIFVAKAGEHIAADGVVAAGESHADESLLTGEATPVSKGPGDTVVAGSINVDGVLEIRATHTAGDSTLARVVASVEQALSYRSSLERTVDRVARVFVPSVVGLALLTFFALWMFHATSLATSMMRAITILVIACPCALGLATPLAITAALGQASRRGILFRDSEILEKLCKVDALVLDKTGTATEGTFGVIEFALRQQECLKPVLVTAINAGSEEATIDREAEAFAFAESRAEALLLTASLEQYSEHPLGLAWVAFAKLDGVSLTDATSLEVLKGQGITGSVRGRRTFIGSRRLLAQQGIAMPPEMEDEAQRWESQGKTVAFFGWDGRLEGLAAFGDRIRSNARELVSELKAKGVCVYLVSGDSRATTLSVATVIGADHYRSEVLPEEKAEFVKSLQANGLTVAMVGDGINDAPALAQADLGIAMGSGTDIAMRAAAVVLMKSSLDRIPEILALASKTMRVVRQNLFWAFFYNAIGITLAIAGILNPIMAAGAMLLSSTSVIVNSLRLTRASKG